MATGSASFDVFNTTATTINAFGAATALTIGATSGTTTIRTPTLALSADSAILNFSSATGTKQIQTGGITHLALMPGGNVGIGTTSPEARLDVVGVIRATGNIGNWGRFTVGGISGMFYPVQFRNDAPGTSVSSDLMIYRSSIHANGPWFGTFMFKVSFHPTNWGHFGRQIEKIEYLTGDVGGPYNDPVGDIVDGSTGSGGDDVIIWLRGGATYEWKTMNTAGAWTLLNGNPGGTSITDSSGVVRDPITSQSTLIVNAKNRFYTNALSLGTAGTLTVDGRGNSYILGNVGIGTTRPTTRLHVAGGIIQSELSTNEGGALLLRNPLKTTAGTAINWMLYNMTGGYGNSLQFWAYDTLGCVPGGLCAPRLTITDAGNVGIGTTAPATRLHVVGTTRGLGGAQILALPTPGTPTVTPQGITGTTTWGYRITARSAVGETLASIEGRTTTGNAILGTTNFNRVAWTAVDGAVDYRIYRTTAGGTPSTTGLIGTTTSTTFDDTGLAASGAVPTIDSSGNVGIGTPNPGSNLHVVGQIRISGEHPSRLTMESQRGFINLWNIDNYAGTLRLFREDYAASGIGAHGVTRMVITDAGNVGIGMTRPTHQLELSLDSAAKPATSTWTIVSDIRVKKDIRPYTGGREVIRQINPVWYKYNGLAGFTADGKDHIGVIAQDIVNVAPYTVGINKTKLNPDDLEKTELLSFNSHALTFALINAFKEMDKEIEELKLQLNQNGDLLQNGQEVNSQFVNSQSNNSLIETIKQALASLGLVIENGIAKVKELFAEKIFTKTARVEKLEMVDKATGKIFCTWIENGEWQKVKSSCDDLATVQSSTLNSGEPAPACVPDWQCSDWQPLPETIACGQPFTQTRTCTDSNNCGIEEGKPTDTQEAFGTKDCSTP
ncbi:MAG: hypothetical protein DDT19_02791 [Syntrophomonadaceae bacterium]|nr:hypothetical protein [Bacillota bacterium]